MKRVALVTGGTGLLGSWLLRGLIARDYEKIYVLARGTRQRSAEDRVFDALRSHTNSVLIQRARKNVEVIDGDIRRPDLGLSPKTTHALLGHLTDIFHAAATADFRIPLDVIRVPNVAGSRHVFELALFGSRQGSVPLRVHHVSTVAVAGTSTGWFEESYFNRGQQFHNSYEQSKFEAEELAHAYRKKGLVITIYRPGIMTGDSKLGRTTNFKMIYQPLHFLAHNLFPELPANAQSFHSLVPVDQVAEAICLLSEVDPPGNPGVWHLLNPSEITVGEFVDTASRVFHCQKPKLIPIEQFPRSHLTALQWDLIEPFVPYFNYRLRFKAERTNTQLRALGFEWSCMTPAMLEQIFRYCVHCGFIPSSMRCPS